MPTNSVIGTPAKFAYSESEPVHAFNKSVYISRF